VILDDWRREELATSMRLRRRDGDLRVSIAVPAGFEGPEGDASPFVAALLLVALACHEDLDVDATVSGRLQRGLGRAVTTYCAWNPALRPAVVRAAGETPVPERAPGVVCLMSRGVDSTFSAAVERVDEELTALVHWRGLEPLHGPATAAAEVRECEAIARCLGLPLVIGETDLRAALDPHAWYHDSHGGVLAGLGIALGGGAGTVVIPGTDSARSLGPMGSSPALDHWLASEWVRIEHDFTGAGRVDKVAAIAAQRPELLPHLKVCFREDRVDNCGRCGKCVLTMCALSAAGALEAATAFPPLDLDLVRAQRPSPLRARHEWSEVLLALGTTGRQGELRRAMGFALRRAARRSWKAPERGFDWAASTRALRLLRDGKPDARASFSALRPVPQPRLRGPVAAPGEVVGLLRSVDRDARRHRYGAGAAPPGEPAGELGALLASDPGDGIPLVLDGAGLPVHPPLGPPPTAGRRLRWALSPLAFAAIPLAARARAVVARLLTRRPAHAAGAGHTAGFLLGAASPNTIPLLLADHPVLPDRLLTTRRAEAADLGYGAPVVLGHLVRAAPVTGTLEPPPCDVPWAHRFGLSRRSG
jgi:hypothetical protein